MKKLLLCTIFLLAGCDGLFSELGALEYRPKAVEVSAGGQHSCALFPWGDVKCWGGGERGQLGQGSTASSIYPVDVDISGVVSLSAGRNHTCAVVEDGGVKCWGAGDRGQVGPQSAARNAWPTEVGIENAREVSSGYHFSCARLATGEVRCWGRGTGGQLGNGAEEDSDTPVAVDSLRDVESISSGGGLFLGVHEGHACTLTGDGNVHCWGTNTARQLGDGSTDSSSTPILVEDVREVKELCTGFAHTCALLNSGRIRCWGAAGTGQLGYGSSPILAPVEHKEVESISTGRSISCGSGHTCAVLEDGSVQCWGQGNKGQNGRQENTNVPHQVEGVSDVIHISAGFQHTCAVTAEGSVFCWGDNSENQLGEIDVLESATPVQIEF